MKHLLSFVLVIIGGACSLCADDDRVFGEFRVAGYLPDYRFADLDIESLRGLTDLIIFSAEPSVEGSLDLRRLENCPWEKFLAVKAKHRVRLFLTIGGWDRSTNFVSVARSPEKRKAFAAAVVRFALDRRVDGIDIDWEHPKDDSEQNAYGELLAELRSAFKPHGLLLTVTIAAWQHLPPLAIDSVDGIQVMAYDHDGKHSTFEGARRDVETLLNGNIPAGKIVLGLPFYGRDVQSRDASTYGEIVSRFAPGQATDQIGQIYFNGPYTIRRKIQYALESQLSGVMIWEIGQDAPGDHSLLKVVCETVSKDGK